jgi:hypothetical protein
MKYIPDESLFPHKSDAFKEALYGYIEMRTITKKPITPHAYKLLFKKLEKVTERTAIEALDRSTENNWTGVYPKEEKKYGFI